jgi:menaquinone-9 beta-reductase
MTTSLLVIGAGPVGLVAAIDAAMRGMHVTLLDPRSDSIDKACGEGLMPGAVSLLERLEISPPGLDLTGVSYHQGHRSVQHLFSHQPGRGVRRLTLHQHLTARAGHLGVQRQRDTALRVSNGKKHVEVTGASGNTYRADYVLACDGLHSRTARTLGLHSKPSPTQKKRYGLRQHFSVTPWSSLIQVYYAADAEVYVTPVAENEVGIALLGSHGMNFDEIVSRVPEVWEHISPATASSTLRGAGPFPQKTTRRSLGRTLLVGDASGYVDAITGEGLRVGFEQARCALDSIETDSPQSYEASWARSTRNFRILTDGLRRLATSPLRGAIVPTATVFPGVFGAIVNRLAR